MATADGSATPETTASTPACAWFEPPVECLTCGACCREAFDAVPVEPGDPTTAAHPELVQVHDDGWRSLRRVPSPTGCGTRCAALTGDGAEQPFHCVIYADRPTACRELEAGSDNCLLARRRVALSAGAPTGPARSAG
jgi:Fe-S-cluster containining protein